MLYGLFCYVLFCCALLFCGVVLCGVVWFGLVFCVVLCFVVVCTVVVCGVLYCGVVWPFVLCCAVLCCVVLCCGVAWYEKGEKLSNKKLFSGDLESLKKDLEDPSRPMKASAFASEEPAPFTPGTLHGKNTFYSV